MSIGRLVPLLLIPILLSALAAACSSSDEGDAGTSGESVAAASTDGGTGAEGEPVVYKLKQELDMNVELTSTVFTSMLDEKGGTYQHGWEGPLDR